MKTNFKFAINCLMSICLAGICVFMFNASAYADGTILSSYGIGVYHPSRGDNSAATIAKEGLWYADHYTTKWQELGEPNGYGVSWSSNGGDFGHDDLYVGDTVKFRFNMHSENVGYHYANILKGWIDWGTDAKSYTFGNDNDNDVVSGFKILRNSAGEQISSDYTFDSWVSSQDADYLNDLDDYGYGNDNEYYEYTLNLTKEHLGTAYLRARVTCSASIVQEEWSGDWYQQWSRSESDYLAAFDAYSDYFQGEIEDWMFTVSLNPVTGGGDPVPEPATLALFGMGLIGLARVCRKKA